MYQGFPALSQYVLETKIPKVGLSSGLKPSWPIKAVAEISGSSLGCCILQVGDQVCSILWLFQSREHHLGSCMITGLPHCPDTLQIDVRDYKIVQQGKAMLILDCTLNLACKPMKSYVDFGFVQRLGFDSNHLPGMYFLGFNK